MDYSPQGTQAKGSMPVAAVKAMWTQSRTVITPIISYLRSTFMKTPSSQTKACIETKKRLVIGRLAWPAQRWKEKKNTSSN